jgi:arginyl-tRNA synthetase
MDHITALKQAFFNFVSQQFQIDMSLQRGINFDLNIDEQKQQFGDISSNIALLLAKQIGSNPIQIAQQIAHNFHDITIEKIEIAPPGFLNIFLTPEAFVALGTALYNHPTQFFALPNTVASKRFLLEFVSANPTGPLHLGHARGGIIGDVLGNILRCIGHSVIKEYYINDAGAQIQKLGASFKARCLQQLGFDVEIPQEGYKGDYLISLAQECVAQHGKKLLEESDDFFALYAKNKLLEQIKVTLHTYGIDFDVWFSEKTLHDSHAITQAIDILINNDTTYQLDGALWFKSTQFGDDKDRVLRRSNGELTYIAADVAYTKNKFERADYLIFALGQDHHSYVTRLKGIAQALGYDPEKLSVILYQLITLQEGGEQLRMSKRAGTMVSLQEIIDTVGVDVARFFFLNRKADAHLDFDIDLALKKTDENPVYYIQYAYVRTQSILQKALHKEELSDITIDDAVGLSKEEHILLKHIVSLKFLLESISNNYQTHLLTYYLLQLAHIFHSYYSKNKVVDMENISKSRARLLLIMVLKNTFELCLDLLGLTKPEKM